MASRRAPILCLLAALLAAPSALAVDPNFRIHADEFPLDPLSRLLLGLNVPETPFATLFAEGYTNAVEVEAATTWDFRGATGPARVLQVAPVDGAWTCYIPESGNIPDRPCGFDRPENDILLVQDGIDTGSRDVLAIDFDGTGTFYLRAWAVDEGGTPATGDEELRLCFWPDGDRKEVPFIVFPNDDGMGRRYLQGGDPPWGSATFDCSSLGSPIGVTQDAPCGTAGGLNAVLTDGDGTNGRVTGRVTSAGTVTLPSGHVLDSLLVEILASFQAVLNPFCIPTGERNRQYLLVWLVPEYGPLIQVRSVGDQPPDLTTWTQTNSTVIGTGLLPPLSLTPGAVTASTIDVSWDPGLLPGDADGFKVYWGTESGHVTAPPNSSPVLDAASGNSWTIPGLLPETTYFVSVTSIRSYTDPISGVTTQYESIVLPTSVGADVDGDGVQDTSYPPEIMATTAVGGPAELAINRQVVLAPPGPTPPVADQFDPGCLEAPFTLCPDERVAGALEGLTLAGEAAPAGPASLWFYEHSDPVTAMKVERQGDDLVFHAN